MDLDFPSFTKQSDVSVMESDQQGWTVIHHLVSPIEYGTYDNVHLLKILVDAGAPLQQKDNAGLTPLDYALLRGATQLAKAMQKLLGKDKKTWVGA